MHFRPSQRGRQSPAAPRPDPTSSGERAPQFASARSRWHGDPDHAAAADADCAARTPAAGLAAGPFEEYKYSRTPPKAFHSATNTRAVGLNATFDNPTLVPVDKRLWRLIGL